MWMASSFRLKCLSISSCMPTVPSPAGAVGPSFVPVVAEATPALTAAGGRRTFTP